MAKIFNIFFSPTGATTKISNAIAKGCAANSGLNIENINITKPASRYRSYEFTSDDIVVVAFPTYAGKLPNKIMPYLRDNIKGNGTKAIAAVTYGNRGFDNSLAELVSILIDNGFKVMGAEAFVTRHAFSDIIAADRPNEDDIKRAEDLSNHMAPIELKDVPGDAKAPYYTPLGEDGAPVNFLKAKPVTDSDVCINCAVCAMNCPMGAIDYKDAANVPGTCIKCHACIRICPLKAKRFCDENFLSHKRYLENNY